MKKESAPEVMAPKSSKKQFSEWQVLREERRDGGRLFVSFAKIREIRNDVWVPQESADTLNIGVMTCTGNTVISVYVPEGFSKDSFLLEDVISPELVEASIPGDQIQWYKKQPA